MSRIAHLAVPTSKLAFKEFPTPALLKALTPKSADHTGDTSTHLLGRVKTAAVTTISTALTVDHTQLKALHAVFVA
ncbi:hypothetical protein SARC_02705 [Sphaeroforma arctica JP610]|uniref:Uncharacterized protein n=1 Tax=Sphaeroforma arctica JP610 TaxID=667725 RepID=A0A0L0G803_9EUKA|nr:hypothetical protein SARC_02705 [Sphaeroforma arctica JP610]KNC85115.1 hypothetical protein SARC_02705 [Sphaeroforma arctica JP610]|eukprot:XP_014159017.1 hypothetical protein SARC_02705 [Sphaeroforma arctica JP610]